MPVYIKIYIYICRDIDTHSMLSSCLNSSMSPLPTFYRKISKFLRTDRPCSLGISFCHSMLFSFFEPHTSALVHHLKWRHHTLAIHLTAFIHRPKSRTGTKWHRDSCLAFFLFPKARTEGKEKGVLWVVTPESFSAPLFSTTHLPCL